MLYKSINPHRLERWMGKDTFNEMVYQMRNWYGPPIAMAGIPGEVYITKDDIIGRSLVGEFASAADKVRDMYKRLRLSRDQLSSGFATVAAVKSAFNTDRRSLPFTLASLTVTAGQGVSWWASGTVPAAGTAGSAAPAGRVPTGGTDGGFYLGAAPTGKNFYFANALQYSNYSTFSGVAPLLLYDRLFDVAKTMNSTTTEAVTGVPTRYTNTSTSTDASYAAGNFLFVETFASIANTAHNWTVCQYTNQAGTANQTIPSFAGTAAQNIGRFDQPANNWFVPLAAGDTGIKALSQMQCSAAVASGSINFVIGRPIAWIPSSVMYLATETGGSVSAFNMCRIFDNACLALIVPMAASSGTNPNYNGLIDIIAG